MRKISSILVIILLALVFLNCSSNNTNKEVEPEKSTRSIASLIDNLKDSHNKEIIVVAHRGDWRNAPENSLRAIQNCIDMGVDMVEIDVRETKDGQLILMHDKTIDRTTTGTGKVSDLTWDYLQTLQLRDGIGHETPHKIPTLEEALNISKDKILINLDKSYDIFDKCYEVMKKTGTLHQVVIKGTKTIDEVQTEFGEYLDKVHFMPVVQMKNPERESIVADYLKKDVPVAFEFTIPQDTFRLIDDFEDIRNAGASVWVNSLWSYLCAGNDDEKAAIDPTVYDWYINHNVDIIQTDRPKLLIEYLRSKGLHD